MALYIKANPKVAEYLQHDRLILNDGNYILWQADMLAFGPLYLLPEILEATGAIALSPGEARQEQDGIKLRELPVATDERFVTGLPTTTETEEGEGNTTGSDGVEADADSDTTDNNLTDNDETV